MAATLSMSLDDMAAIPLPRSPRAHTSSGPLPTDSMVTVRLSDPAPEVASSPASSRTPSTSSLSLAPTVPLSENGSSSAESDESDETTTTTQHLHKKSTSSVEVMNGLDLDTELNGPRSSISQRPLSDAKSIAHTSISTVQADDDYCDDDSAQTTPAADSEGTGSITSNESEDVEDQVDWVELDKTEESVPRNEESDESTAFLLARLEQANQMLASDQKFGGPKRNRSRKQSRPPSISALKKLVKDPKQQHTARLSDLPEPPPLTELEFWAALVKDYQQTAQRLPTLTANKVKGGVPPPIRGLVWISMVGARDADLAELFDKLVLEPSPWDTNIAKDVGRSFPLVEMFKDPKGRGQQMLGRVLKAFSLYDEEIGYCQGLGFLVGPLLMQMDDRDAFCVLVRLMENFDLRSCFLPDLSGLHLRIFQFQRLLEQDMPELAAHLKALQLEAAFLSQWFLSFFAVTCPLDMLFRIYDVIFAEGASETIMRVALALMKRNEEFLRGSEEFDVCMKLLLQPALWDVYEGDADAMVHDFMGMTGIVTRDSLAQLEHAFKTGSAKKEASRPLAFADVTAAASSFIGRLWTAQPTNSLSPEAAAGASSGPFSALRRSTSKQSLASTIQSTDISSEGTGSVGTITTATTDLSRNSSADVVSIRSKTESVAAVGRIAKDRDLHMQIEDLLAALGEMQRDTAVLSAQLQKEREEREEDKRLLRDLNEHIKSDTRPAPTDGRRRTLPPAGVLPPPAAQMLSDKLKTIVERVDDRLAAQDDMRRSSMLETKQQLRESLARHKDQLAIESSKSAELGRQLDFKDKELLGAREELRDARQRLQHDFAERQKLERTVSDLRSSVAFSDDGYSPYSPTAAEAAFTMRPVSSSTSSPGGLRELKLGKRDSKVPATTSYHPPRGSSLATKEILATSNHAPPAEEAVLLELVNAKTAEAVARQEIDELKNKLESTRKQLQQATAPSLVSSWAGSWGSSASKTTTTPTPPPAQVGPTPASAPQTSAGADETSERPKLATSTSMTSAPTTTTPASTSAGSSGGGFWSWGKRSLSSASVVTAATAGNPSSGS